MNTENIEFPDFMKVQMCAGTVTHAEVNSKANKPSYILTIDFGSLGMKTSSAQITEHYSLEDLVGEQVIAVMNFEAKRIAGVKSEVLVLATMSDEDGTVLLRPTKKVANGTPVS